jgi:hypothetical protein
MWHLHNMWCLFQEQEPRVENAGEMPLEGEDKNLQYFSFLQNTSEEQRSSLPSAVSPIIICGHFKWMRLLSLGYMVSFESFFLYDKCWTKRTNKSFQVNEQDQGEEDGDAAQAEGPYDAWMTADTGVSCIQYL